MQYTLRYYYQVVDTYIVEADSAREAEEFCDDYIAGSSIRIGVRPDTHPHVEQIGNHEYPAYLDMDIADENGTPIALGADDMQDIQQHLGF